MNRQSKRLRLRAAAHYTVYALVGVVVAAFAANAVLWPRHGVPAPVPVPVDRFFSASYLHRMGDFRTEQRLLAVASMGVALAVPFVVALKWRTLVPRSIGGRGVAVTSALIIFGLFGAVSLATLPLDSVAFQRSRDFGLVVQSFSGWLADRAVGLLIMSALAGVGALLALTVIRRLPRAWWAAFSIAVVLFAAAFTMLAPVLIAPLFGDFKVLAGGEVRDDVELLARQGGVEVGEVYVVDAAARTTASNAYVAGIGRTKRVVLYDTLINGDFSRSEVRAVVAHELGHTHYNDLGRGLIWLAIVTPFGMFAVDRFARLIAARTNAQFGRPESLPALVAAVLLVAALAGTISNQLSRRVEARADAYSLNATGDSASAVALERRLTIKNLGDPDPPKPFQLLFGTHPTAIDRIGSAIRQK